MQKEKEAKRDSYGLIPPPVGKEDAPQIDFVKWFSELNRNSIKTAGGKGANLSEIYNLGISVPPGFVVTAQAYDFFIEKAGLKNQIKEILSKINYEDTEQLEDTAKEIRDLILKAVFPKEMEEEILEAYENLDTRNLEINRGSALDILKNASEPIFVAVRSSATAEDLADASFAGQQDSYVNIKGKQELILHIKKCFASLFTARATYYRNKKGFKHETTSLAVVVQKMIDSDKSGVIFSKDPAYKNNNIVMEAVWGLGEGIVSGKITPDRYIVSADLEIADKKIADKKIAITRSSDGSKTVAKLREEKSKHQVLKNNEIRRLAEIALKLEEHYQKPQDIEFAIEGEEIFIVQTRPITTIEKRHKEVQEIKGEIILEGLAASPGIASGKVKIIEDLKDLNKIKTGDILVTKMTNPDMVVTMQKSAAIVTDDGGMTAHASIVSREMGIPAVVGTGDATAKLKEGEIITVNGFTGKIYKGKVAETEKKEILPVTAGTKTDIKVIVDLPTFAKRAAQTGLKKVGLTRIEGIIAESGKHPNYFLQKNKINEYEEIIFNGIKGIAEYFETIWVRTSDIRSDEFQNLEGAPQEKEANPMLGMHGIRYGLKHPEILKAELKALKRVAENGKEVGLLSPQIISVEEVQQLKKIVNEIGFSDAKIGVMVETPAAVQLIREICDEGIDFISFGTNDLTQYILAVDRGNEEVQHLYNEMHPAILHQLEFVIRVCKRQKVETSICGQAGSKKEMVKFLVEKGIDSITVNADAAKDISEYIAELESSAVRGTDEEPRQYEITKQKEQEERPSESASEQKEKPSGSANEQTKENFVKPQNVVPEYENNNLVRDFSDNRLLGRRGREGKGGSSASPNEVGISEKSPSETKQSKKDETFIEEVIDKGKEIVEEIEEKGKEIIEKVEEKAEELYEEGKDFVENLVHGKDDDKNKGNKETQSREVNKSVSEANANGQGGRDETSEITEKSDDEPEFQTQEELEHHEKGDDDESASEEKQNDKKPSESESESKKDDKDNDSVVLDIF